MQELFVAILNMSITAGYVILAVLLARLLLRRAPKKYTYLPVSYTHLTLPTKA